MIKGYLPGLGKVDGCFISLSLCVLFRFCGRGRTRLGAGGVSTVLSEAVEIGEVISDALGF
jgi:hypothetical protein